jgi:hypothetical protein
LPLFLPSFAPLWAFFGSTRKIFAPLLARERRFRVFVMLPTRTQKTLPISKKSRVKRKTVFKLCFEMLKTVQKKPARMIGQAFVELPRGGAW